uniref:RNA-directed DNA polymerase n=1 Tax=Trichuris muris TaxID=70415 RepID=A0A5S6QL73_TRIMR
MECYRCGGEHYAKQCRFITERCRYCQKVGHIERACLKKNQRNRNNPAGTRRWKNRPPDRVRSHAVAEQQQVPRFKHSSDTYFLNSVKSGTESPILAHVRINDKPLTMEVDSGSACSLISERVFRQLKLQNVRQTHPAKVLRTWSRETLDARSQIEVKVQFSSQKCRLPLLVVKGLGASLLGRDWFQALGISVLGVNQVIRKCYDSLLSRYSALFNEDINAYRGPPVSIELECGATPKFLKCRPVPFAIRPRLHEAIEKLVKQGILETVRHSKWATPVVPVLKRTGELRICGDYRSTVNSATKKDTYPLPTVAELLSTISGGVLFSKLDLAQAYQQLKVNDETAQLLTVNTPKGLMKVTRLPFGVDVAPSIFQRFMDTCLAGLDGVKAYLDDVLITRRTEDEHWERVDAVLQRLDKAGIRLQRDKCLFGVQEVEYVGFRIDKLGVHPTQQKVEAVQKAPTPTSNAELKAFLGLFNFYSCFIPGKAEVLEPLHRLLDAETVFSWKKSHEQAFRRAKELLQSSNVLIHYDPEKKLTLTCDASPHGVGAVLSQPGPHGKEAPVAFASRTLSKTERNYAQIDREALAIIYAVQKFHQYVYGRAFTIITDHEPLLGLLHPDKALPQVMSPRMLRWSLMLSVHDYQLLYQPGPMIANADGLSRLPMPSADWEVPPIGDVLLLETDVEAPVDAKLFERLTRGDKVLAQVMRWTLRGWPAEKQPSQFQPFVQRQAEISAHRNCLLWGSRVIVPEKARSRVLKLLHEAHPGVVRMKALARSYVWWPQLDRDIEDIVKRCNLCQ